MLFEGKGKKQEERLKVRIKKTSQKVKWVHDSRAGLGPLRVRPALDGQKSKSLFPQHDIELLRVPRSTIHDP
jgi:hypothetical protein